MWHGAPTEKRKKVNKDQAKNIAIEAIKSAVEGNPEVSDEHGLEMAWRSGLLDTLKTILGPSGWVSATESDPYITDITGLGAPCIIVACPGSTEQVAQTVKACAKAGVAIVPQGGNSNVCTMAVPLDGQDVVIMSLMRMNKIIHIYASASTASVEAGVLMQTLLEAAIVRDRIFAPDWGARGTASVARRVCLEWYAQSY